MGTVSSWTSWGPGAPARRPSVSRLTGSRADGPRTARRSSEVPTGVVVPKAILRSNSIYNMSTRLPRRGGPTSSVRWLPGRAAASPASRRRVERKTGDFADSRSGPGRRGSLMGTASDGESGLDRA